MELILWVFAAIGFFMVGILICGFVVSLMPEEYSSGADGDWERYVDRCNGNYDEKNDRPKKKR